MMTGAVAGVDVQATETGPAMRTVCLGRYLVDVPEEAVYQGQIAYFQGRHITVVDKTEEQFLSSYVAFVEEQKKAKHRTLPSRFRREIVLDDYSKAVFFFSNEITEGSFDAHIHFWRDGKSFLLKSGVSIDREARATERISRLLSTFQRRNDEDIPLKSGYCFDGGFVEDDGSEFLRESISYGFRWNDIDIELSSMPKFREDEPGLLKRVDDYDIPESMRADWKMVKTIRRGKRATTHVKGEELLQTFPVDDGGRFHMYLFETDSKYHDLLSPAVKVSLESAWNDLRNTRINSTMSERDLLKLFDRMVNSIRLRPTNGAAMTQSGGNAHPGVHVRSGERAPQTGRYRHQREGALTPTIMRFEQGQRLPPVELKDPRSLMERLRGKPAVLAEDVVWVRLPDDPGADVTVS